ncbi:Uncharacterized protein FWK35_00038328 [Aphis craccivora]|uniref:THAP-type domain-containing protein n=1 Tax=Aphis craccivora TaxID=307492 RepID=A0A6G0VPU7_APHCR|nr:Uncharacterized protein FWK35_00038328 [Aphis craccivora]
MNVRLATQVLSSSVSKALTFCQTIDKEFDKSSATAEFCLKINNAFDILNCRTKFSKNPYNQALSLNTFDKYEHFINEFETYIYGLQLTDGCTVVNSLRKTGFIGLVWGLKNLLICFNTLRQNYNMEYVLSYKMSQDHLETFFSAMRSRGGYNNNPSAKEFKTSYKKLLVHHHVSGSQYGNCLPESMFTTKQNIIPDSIIQDTDTDSIDSEQDFGFQNDHDYFHTHFNVSAFVENITEYISGFIAKKALKQINCDVCKGYLVDNKTNNILINIKDRNNALTKPSKDVFYLCSVSEKWIRCKQVKDMYKNNFINKLYLQIKNDVYRSVFNTSTMDTHISGQTSFTNHKEQLISIIINTYITLRLRSIAKQTENSKISIRKKFTKLITFRNE